MDTQRSTIKLLSTAEAAAFLGRNKRTLANWRFLGIGPAYIKQNGRSVGYLEEDLIEFVRRNRIEPNRG